MTPTTEAPVAPPEQEVPTDAESVSAESPSTETPEAAAAAPQEDPQVKKLRDRLAEQGRELAENKRLALQQANELAALNQQLAQIGQYMTQQQVQSERARFASMEPEQQSAYLNEKLLQLQTQPPRQAVPQPVAPTTGVDPRVLAAVDAINLEYGLDADPLTPEDVGWHPDEASWRKAATLIARAKAKEGTPVPAKNVESKKPLTEDQIIERAAQKLRQEMGIGRPNAASPVGTAKSGMSIEALNKMASDPSMSPRARAEKMRQLPA